MDCLSKVINLVQQGDWAISVDLADAYLHIPIHIRFRKFLRFCVQGKAFQFTCLCFGPTLAPRVFTKMVSAIAAHLRLQNVRLAVYLDDWFVILPYLFINSLSDKSSRLGTFSTDSALSLTGNDCLEDSLYAVNLSGT